MGMTDHVGDVKGVGAIKYERRIASISLYRVPEKHTGLVIEHTAMIAAKPISKPVRYRSHDDASLVQLDLSNPQVS